MNGKINPWKLWRGRLYRIAPLYLFSLLIMLLLAVIQTGGQWLALENWQPLLRLFALGALHWQPVGPVDFNAYNAGVVWTLWYEWSFYLLLPFIAWLAVGRKIFAAAPVFCFLIFACLWFNLNVEPALFFILGMLCPALLEDQTVRSQLRRPAAAILAVTITGLLCLACRSPLPKQMSFGSVEGALLPVFFVTAAGNTFGGFLTHPAVRCLGAMSFSLYLLHGIGLKLVFRLLQAHGLTDLTPPAYWLVITVTATVITLICSLTYRWIEFPFLSNSHKVSGRNTTAGQ
jgi:peptidoglycan/LPS O-acetylase OafA/YrhL